MNLGSKTPRHLPRSTSLSKTPALLLKFVIPTFISLRVQKIFSHTLLKLPAFGVDFLIPEFIGFTFAFLGYINVSYAKMLSVNFICLQLWTWTWTLSTSTLLPSSTGKLSFSEKKFIHNDSLNIYPQVKLNLDLDLDHLHLHSSPLVHPLHLHSSTLVHNRWLFFEFLLLDLLRIPSFV